MGPITNDTGVHKCIVELDLSRCTDRVPAVEVSSPNPGRIGSVLAGGTLAACGLARGRMSGWCLVLAGGALIWRGLTGWSRNRKRLSFVPLESGLQSQRLPLDDALINDMDRFDAQLEHDEICPLDGLSEIVQPQLRLQVGDTVWDASGTKRGKVVDVEELPIGPVDPSDWCGVSYEVEWEEVRQDTRKLRLDNCEGHVPADPRLLIGSRGEDDSRVQPVDAMERSLEDMGIMQCGPRRLRA